MHNSKVTLRIEMRTIVRFLAAVALFGLLVLAVFKLATVLVIFAVAFFLAIALNPPVSRLASLLPGHNRILATALAYLVVLLVLGALIYVAVPPIVQQTSSFVNNFPSYINSLADQKGALSGIIEHYNLENELNQFLHQLQQGLGSVAQGVGSTLVSGVTSVLTGFITILTILVLTFLMLIEGPFWIKRLWGLYSHKNKLKRDQRLVKQMYHVVTGYVNGQVLIAAIAAAAVFVVLFVLGQFFPNVPLGAIIPLTGVAFVGSLIPMFGATLAAIIISIVLLLNSIPAAIIFIIYFIIYQQIENNVIQPVVQSRSIQLTALAVFSAAIVGIALLGILGAIIAIPIAGCLRVLALDFMQHRHDYFNHRNEAEHK